MGQKIKAVFKWLIWWKLSIDVPIMPNYRYQFTEYSIQQFGMQNGIQNEFKGQLGKKYGYKHAFKNYRTVR